MTSQHKIEHQKTFEFRDALRMCFTIRLRFLNVGRIVATRLLRQVFDGERASGMNVTS